jgi:hypothetical protein
MASSRIDHELGFVEITAPGGSLAYPVGMRFIVNGGLAHALKLERELRRASLTFATYRARLCLPAAANAAVVPDPARLEQAREMGLVHESLLEPPDALAA